MISQQECFQELSTPDQTFGDLPLLQSTNKTDRQWTSIRQINESFNGKCVLIRARITLVRSLGKLVFLIIREGYHSIQGVLAKTRDEGKVSKEMIQWTQTLPQESIVDIQGTITTTKTKVKFCTQSDVELQISLIFTVSRSNSYLPFGLVDDLLPAELNEVKTGAEQITQGDGDATNSAEKHEEQKSSVSLYVRLDNRVFDLRTRMNQALFRCQSGVGQLFREFLYEQDFMEIHTPKLLGGQQGGDYQVFKLKYFEKDAHLALSTQLYRQRCIASDFHRVFEVGPLFEVVAACGAKHLCEFTSLDFEMTIKESYEEILRLTCRLFDYLLEGLKERFSSEISIIRAHHPCEPLMLKKPTVKLTYEEAVDLLKQDGLQEDLSYGLTNMNSRTLGEIVRKKYETDFFIIHKFPSVVKSFDTMPSKDDSKFTNSYSLFLRGVEFATGTQRIHELEFLQKRAQEQGIHAEIIDDYSEVLKYGMYPHAGCAIGLERFLMQFFDLGNIRKCSLFPRDCNRITP